MYYVQFSPAKVKVYSDVRLFESRVRRFISLRETENNTILAMMPQLLQGIAKAIPFTVEEDQMILAVGLYMLNSGGIIHSWAPPDAIEAIVEHAVTSGWVVTQFFGPAHTTYFSGRTYAQRTKQRFELGRAERVYQITHNTYKVPEDGHLRVANESDMPLLERWLAGFVEEADYENDGRTIHQMAAEMIGARVLYFWNAPRAVSMAAWVCPTPAGGTINFVYTPPELRGRGYAKAVTAALAAQMLASGLKYCSIRTDVDDAQTNAMYQSIGAQSLCEFVRCTIHPLVQAEPGSNKKMPLAIL
jgi:uncharacterized protein